MLVVYTSVVFLVFVFSSSRVGKRITMQNLRLGSPTALVHLCGIWPPEFYDIIGLLVVLFNFNTSILVTGVAPASLPLIEANVHSFLYGVWRAWQLTRYLAKALSRCVCWFHHTSLNNFYDIFDINNHLHCLHCLATRFFIDLLKEELQTNHKPLSTFSAWTQ